MMLSSRTALVRQHWTPADGSIHLDQPVTWCSAPVESDGTAHVVVSAIRELMHLRAPLTDYPTLSWFAEVVDTAVAVPIATGVVLGIDPAGQAMVVDSSGDEHALCPGVRTDELTACSTTLTEVQAMRWIMVLLIRYR